jgi:uncharacterized protein (DUF885 family)
MSIFGSARVAVLAIMLAASAAQASPAGDLHALIGDYERFAREQDPLRAAQRGDAAAAVRWPDDAPAAVDARKRTLEGFDKRINRLAKSKLSPADALERDVLADRVATSLEGLAFDEERMPFISGEGFFVNPDYAAAFTALRDEKSAIAWLKRIEALPAYYDIQVANMRRGIKTKFTQPKLVVESTLRTVRAQAELPVGESPLLKPLAALPETVPNDARQRLITRGLELVRTRVRPAQAALVKFLETEYLPVARPELAARTLPGGERYYPYVVRRHTTTTLTPDEIHAIGLKEVARVRGEMDAVIAETGFNGGFAAFLAFLRSDPQFFPRDADDLMQRTSEVANRVNGTLPRWFGKLPRLTYAVVFIPETLENASAGYWPGNPRDGIAGQVLLRRQDAARRTLYDLPAWVLHEGAPGHHTQIALAEELKGLPEYRRNDDVTAFVEGWALYAEHLGVEMGLYRTPYERFGQLSMEMWRACRLVIDTGLHWLGWTREQAVACLRDNSALAPAQVEFEVDRYIGWPGQALAYKIGDNEIRRIRAEAKSRIGACFDVRAFHDALLAAGALPLSLLRTHMESWIRSQSRTGCGDTPGQ